MPTYVYSCTACGHQFEQYQSFSDDSLEVCPECAGRLRKVFNSVGLVFKGSGFYVTDKNSTGTAASSAASSSDSSSSDSSSSVSSTSDSSGSTSSTSDSSSSASSSGGASTEAA